MLKTTVYLTTTVGATNPFEAAKEACAKFTENDIRAEDIVNVRVSEMYRVSPDNPRKIWEVDITAERDVNYE